MSGSKRIGVLAALSDLNPAYSIAAVTLDHLRLLAKYHNEIVFITTSDFVDKDNVLPKNVVVRTFPRIKEFHSPRVDPDKFDLLSFEKYVFECSSIFNVILKDIEILITHDVMFLDGFLWVNASLRNSNVSHIKFLNWVHSGPSLKPANYKEYPINFLYEPIPNSVYCYPNSTDTMKVSEMFQCPYNQIRTVFNYIDPYTFFNFDPLTIEILESIDPLYTYDHICVYPTRMCEAKQIDKCIKLLAALNNLDRKVLFIICNSWSNNPEQTELINKYRELCLEHNFNNVIFTSQHETQLIENINLGLPRKVISDLMRISDLFILPSISETASLVMLEASLNKNMIILNDDLQCMHEFGGQKMDNDSSSQVLYYDFGSVTRPINSYLPDEETWYRDHANKLINYIDADKSITHFRKIRKYHNPDWVYHNQIEPLL